MKISVHAMAVDTFVPMLESLAAILDKGLAYAESAKTDLVNARLAPDMYTLAQQVQLACHYARDAAASQAAPPRRWKTRRRRFQASRPRLRERSTMCAAWAELLLLR
jgi:Domain of unknown function (DUF1993)